MRYKQLNYLIVTIAISILNSNKGFSQNNLAKWSTFSIGAEFTTVSNIEIVSTIGQSFINQIQSSNNIVQSGFFVNSLVFNSVTGVKESKKIPSSYKLEQNFPNPFNPSTTISYQLPQAGFVELKIYDILGREITTLVKQHQEKGKYSIDFDASGLASGMLIYQIKINDFVSTKKMMLLK